MFRLMELDEKSLKNLIERAHALHDRLSDEIKSSVSFCRFCSERGRYCDVAETPFEVRERLITTMDSLKEVENMLIYIQRLQARRLIDKDVALTRLENSRLYLMEQVKGYEGKDIDVVKELNACFGNQRITFNCNWKESREADDADVHHNGKRRLPSFLMCLIRFYFNPRRWQKAVGSAIKLIAISASISSTIQLYHSSQKYSSSQRKNLSFVDSTNAIKNPPLTISKSQLDVFHGRG